MLKITNSLLVVFIAFFNICCNQSEDTSLYEKKALVATIDNDNIYLNEIDSIVSLQQYQLRLNALQMEISKKILEAEAKKQNIPLKNLIEKQVNQKSRKVTTNDFRQYTSQLNSSKIDTANIYRYIETIHQKERQQQYVDSLKQNYSIKIKLQPPFYNIVETDEIQSHNLTENISTTEVFVITDFMCPACQQAEKELKKLYRKYNNTVNFRFVTFSSYIGKSALACEASANQDKFKQMHDIIFDNPELLNNESIYHDFAEEIGLNMAEFEEDVNSPELLKGIINNKELLISKKIYSTPTFIVNGKVLEDKYAINYLEDVIIDELKLKN